MMRTNIQVLEQLVIEIIDICLKKQLRLFAITRDAENLLKGIARHKTMIAADFGVFAEDYFVLKEELSKIKERGCEDLNNNCHMPGNYMMYVDLGTTYDSVTEPGTSLYNGIHLNIYPIVRRPNKSIRDRIINQLERILEYEERKKVRNYTIQYRFNKSIINILWGLFNTVVGVDNLQREILHRSLRSSGKYTVHMPNRKICSFSEKELEEYPSINVMGLFVTLFPEDSEVYEYYHTRRKLSGSNAVFSANIPWESFITNIRVSQKQKKLILKTLRYRKKNYFPKLEAINKYWIKLQCSYERFQYFDIFKDNKDDNLALYANEQFEELYSSIKEYVSRLKYYIKYDLAFCFDVDYFEMALVLLIWKGHKDIVIKALNLVKLEHIEPIDEYLLRHDLNRSIDDKKWKKKSEQLFITIQKAFEEIVEEKEGQIDVAKINEKEKRKRFINQLPPAYQCVERDNGIEIILLVHNDDCNNECLNTIKHAHYDDTNDCQFLLDNNYEFICFHIFVNRIVMQSDIWKVSLAFFLKNIDNDKGIEYLHRERARYFFDKLVLCNL